MVALTDCAAEAIGPLSTVALRNVALRTRSATIGHFFIGDLPPLWFLARRYARRRRKESGDSLFLSPRLAPRKCVYPRSPAASGARFLSR
jgi:hypothetical protein